MHNLRLHFGPFAGFDDASPDDDLSAELAAQQNRDIIGITSGVTSLFLLDTTTVNVEEIKAVTFRPARLAPDKQTPAAEIVWRSSREPTLWIDGEDALRMYEALGGQRARLLEPAGSAWDDS